MCDEITEAENEAFLSARITRRQANLGAGATLAALVAGCKSSSAPREADPMPAVTTPHATTSHRTDPTATNPTATKQAVSNEPEASDTGTKLATISRMVAIETPDGEAEAFFVAPKSGKHPGVLYWPDVAGLRDAFKKMATRLASQGYAVVLVNPYYRSSKLPILTTFSEWRTEEGKAKIGPMREVLTAERVASDGAAFCTWLDQQPEVDRGKKLATAGYCMSGPFTFHTAAAAPSRVGVLASFHGGGLVSDDENSPHMQLSKLKAAALVCIAENDDTRQPEAKTVLMNTAKAAKVTAEVEVYPAQHGWCVIDSPVYDRAQAERAWARLSATLEAHL